MGSSIAAGMILQVSYFRGWLHKRGQKVVKDKTGFLGSLTSERTSGDNKEQRKT
jgi:hypothetical protein